MFRSATRIIWLLIAIALPSLAQDSANDPRLKHSFRQPAKNGWTFVHLEGQPAEIGFQHGYLLSAEIEDMLKVSALEMAHDQKKDWQFLRDAARAMMWPHIEQEYREELQGIVDGANARGVKLDLWDVVALNGTLEWEYYVKQYDKEHGIQPPTSLVAPEHCSAFVATGSYTRDGKIVIAHNNWTGYLDGERWVVIFDIAPTHGQRMLMDGMPGVITSDDDFVINDAGMMVTETTITQFEGWDPSGKPEFVRSRKAIQYAKSIDDYVRIIKDGNNGGYANDWLIGDRKTGEIAYLELGLKNTPIWRTKDGYYVSSNFARDPKLIKEETSGFDPSNLSSSMNARHVRAEELVQQNKGKIDVAFAEQFLGDHGDSFEHKTQANERTLCGHVDASPRGVKEWSREAYAPEGAVQGKATDASMAANMSLVAHAGHPCGEDFIADKFLEQHPEYSWQKPLLRDMKAGPWTKFSAGDKAEQ